MTPADMQVDRVIAAQAAARTQPVTAALLVDEARQHHL